MDVQRKLRQHLRSHVKIIPSVIYFVNKYFSYKNSVVMYIETSLEMCYIKYDIGNRFC